MNHTMGGPRANESIDGLIAQRARRQQGVFTRAQASDLGASDRQIEHRLRTGRWSIVLPRVFRIAGGVYTGKMGAMAAVLWAGEGAVLSHGAAAALWGFEGVRAPKPEVWVPAPRRPKSDDVAVHRGPRLEGIDVTEFASIPITSPTRTLIDVAGRLEDEALLTVVERVIKRRMTTERLVAERASALRSAGRPGVGRLASLLDARPCGARALESRLEARCWLLLVRSGLTLPVRQHWVTVGARHYRLDFAWPEQRVAVECDGRAYHDLTFEDGERRRADLASIGLLVLPVTWRQLSIDWLGVRARLERALRQVA